MAMNIIIKPIKLTPAKPKINRCKTCKYFENDKCKLFFHQTQSNEVVYIDAVVSRLDESLCGFYGKYHQPLIIFK